MNDEELIKYIWALYMDVIGGGSPSEGELETAWSELVKRGFESGEVLEGYY